MDRTSNHNTARCGTEYSYNDSSVIQTFDIIWRCRIWIVPLSLVLTGLSAAYLFTRPISYTTMTELRMRSVPSSPVISTPLSIEAHYRLITSTRGKATLASSVLTGTGLAQGVQVIVAKPKKNSHINVTCIAPTEAISSKTLRAWISEYRRLIDRHLSLLLLDAMDVSILSDVTKRHNTQAGLDFLRRLLAQPRAQADFSPYLEDDVIAKTLLDKSLAMQEIEVQIAFKRSVTDVLRDYSKGKIAVLSDPKDEALHVFYARSLLQMNDNIIFAPPVTAIEENRPLLATSLILILSLSVFSSLSLFLEHIKHEVQERGQPA